MRHNGRTAGTVRQGGCPSYLSRHKDKSKTLPFLSAFYLESHACRPWGAYMARATEKATGMASAHSEWAFVRSPGHTVFHDYGRGYCEVCMKEGIFEEWAILELMGHRRLAGVVTEQSIGGSSFIRIDVPGDGEFMKATQFYNPNAIYCITPTTETIARKIAERDSLQPVQRWELEDNRPNPNPDTVAAYGFDFDDDSDDDR